MTFVWLLLGTIAALFVGLVVWVRRAQGYGREDFAHLVRSLLFRMENGGLGRLAHTDSDVWFRFERLSGSGRMAVLSLRIPKAEWSSCTAEEIQRVFTAHGFEYRPEPDSCSLLATVRVPVENIWAGDSGARGSLAARLLLDTIGVTASARFRASEVGRPSRRVLENRELLDR